MHSLGVMCQVRFDKPEDLLRVLCIYEACMRMSVRFHDDKDINHCEHEYTPHFNDSNGWH